MKNRNLVVWINSLLKIKKIGIFPEKAKKDRMFNKPRLIKTNPCFRSPVGGRIPPGKCCQGKIPTICISKSRSSIGILKTKCQLSESTHVKWHHRKNKMSDKKTLCWEGWISEFGSYAVIEKGEETSLPYCLARSSLITLGL